MTNQISNETTTQLWENVRLTLDKKLTNVSPFLGRVPAHFYNGNIFVLMYNDIPSEITLKGMDCKKAEKWTLDTYGQDIIRQLYDRKQGVKDKNPVVVESVFCFKKSVLVVFNHTYGSIQILYNDSTLAQADMMTVGLSKMKKRQSQHSSMILIMDSGRGIEHKEVELTRPRIRINEHYNDDFIDVDQVIYRRLSKKNDKGIVLLHGKPGTGKTSYIRHLISRIRKTIIFLPPGMVEKITHPEFITLLADHPNAVLIIEDAESLLLDRERAKNVAVSGLLNLSDGLLSDCLNIQIICSFNTDISKIDSALLRKGRLIAAYEFKELQVDKAQNLSTKLGYKVPIEEPMTLSAIFHQSEANYHRKPHTKIGF